MRKTASWIGGMVLGIFLVVSCGTSAKHVAMGMADMLGLDGIGSPGDGLVGDATAGPLSCTADELFCDGTKVFTCTHSGTDSVNSGDCNAGQSTTNPGTCVTTGCYAGATACCGHQKNYEQWAFTAPYAESGFKNTGYEGNSSASVSVSCGAVSANHAYNRPSGPSCGGGTDNTYIDLGMQKGFTPGQTVTLPNAAVTLSYEDIVSGAVTICSQWTVTVTWNSDVPSPMVTINATCSQAGLTGIQVIGTMTNND